MVSDNKVTFSDVPHVQNFIDAVKNGGQLNCDIEEGYKSTLLAHLGNLAYRVGRALKFDAHSQSIVGDQEANSLMKRTGRNEFSIPDLTQGG